jgi:hypothetical protein
LVFELLDLDFELVFDGVDELDWVGSESLYFVFKLIILLGDGFEKFDGSLKSIVILSGSEDGVIVVDEGKGGVVLRDHGWLGIMFKKFKLNG